ncbi:unnamed protein product, partial [Ectocarpus fasciculatus]
MALQPHGGGKNGNARGISAMRVLVLHKKSLSSQHPAGRDNHHPESYAADDFSAEEEKRLGMSMSIRTAVFGGMVSEGRGSLRRRRKGGLAAAARTGGGGGDLKGTAAHFSLPPSTLPPPAAPATPPRGTPYYEYAYEENGYPAAVSSPAGHPTTDARGLPDTQPQVSRNVSFSEEVE